MIVKEVRFQDELRDRLSTYKFDGLEIVEVERDHPVGDEEVGLTLIIRGQRSFMFIETKKKPKAKSQRDRRIYSPNPLGTSVVNQVISFAELYEKNNKYLVLYLVAINTKRTDVFRVSYSNKWQSQLCLTAT